MAKLFATNFNPEINIREVTQRGKYWKRWTMDRNGATRNSQAIELPGNWTKRIRSNS